jgi:hypothetical protein
MRQRGQDRQRRTPGRLWRSPFGKRRGRRHSTNDRLPPEENAPSSDQGMEKIPEQLPDRTAKKPL